LRDVRSAGANLGALNSVASLGYSIAPLLTQVVTEVDERVDAGLDAGDRGRVILVDSGDDERCDERADGMPELRLGRRLRVDGGRRDRCPLALPR